MSSEEPRLRAAPHADKATSVAQAMALARA
jgi:hypothetical protein